VSIDPSSRASALEQYDLAAAALHGLIRGDRADSRSTLTRRRRAEAKLARSRTLLDALGNPHRRYPVVHVTGTSGKGSTSAAIAATLSAAGYRVGLRTSPYLQVATEKLQIGSSLIDAESFHRLTEEVLAVGYRLFRSESSDSHLGYAETWSALAFSYFAEQNVEVAVVEVGAGGRFDATNVVSPIVSVITSVGLDHVISLGPTIADIAWHKAGIIKRGATAVVGNVSAEAWSVIRAVADDEDVAIVGPTDPADRVDLPGLMHGDFQKSNASVAIAAVEALRQNGFPIPDTAISEGIKNARMPGRLERMPGSERSAVWIDGAHNADKIAAIAREAPTLSENGSPPVIILGVLAAKDASSIAGRLVPVASAFVATEFTVLGKKTSSASNLAAALQAAGFTGPIVVEPEPTTALAAAEAMAHPTGSALLATGSLYLAGELRRRWYPNEDIVLQRTPWPVTGAARQSLAGLSVAL
jgi:dihydrofolate synthase/folylpolyglutamate synthase